MIFLRLIAKREHVTNEGGYDDLSAEHEGGDIEVTQGYFSEIDYYNI